MAEQVAGDPDHHLLVAAAKGEQRQQVSHDVSFIIQVKSMMQRFSTTSTTPRIASSVEVDS